MNTIEQAIEQYCNYQERCHQQVRDKLYTLGANSEEVECLIATLIEKDILNEQRFANACLLYTSPSPRDVEESRMPSSA